MTILVNLSDSKLSDNPEDVLAAYSLGSCVGVSLYDPVARIGGLLHYQLPTAELDPVQAKANPAMFADTGMALLLNAMTVRGAERKRLRVAVAGAAQGLSGVSLFNVGKRNHVAIRKILWQQGLFVEKEDTGGTAVRNLYLSIANGEVVVKRIDGNAAAEPASAATGT